MEFLKNWIMGICGCTILVTLICSLIPNTACARLVRVCGTVVMVFAVFAPLKTIRPEDLRVELDIDRLQSAETVMAERERFEISIIEEQLSEYVLQRANQLGIECEVSVSVGKDENGMLLPQKIEIWGIGQTWQLEHAIENECGIKPIVFDQEVRDT